MPTLKTATAAGTTTVAISVAGIFAPHTKCIGNKVLALVYLATLLLSGVCCLNAVASSAATSALAATEPHECSSIDVRNECDSLLQLQGCTVIKGYLLIVLLPRSQKGSNVRPTCPYERYTFPLLREITDYLIYYDVKGLTSIRQLFPKLTVIRGRRLFLNYALGISGMPDLEVVEFNSLVAIQRGHVFIGSSPKLCHLEKVNFDRLTLSIGENHIYPVSPETCSKSVCRGCKTEYCWSDLVCQKFENDNVMNPMAGISHCHEQCLGGCNITNQDCMVCRTLTDHGVCVDRCSSGKFLLEHYQRCYTREECVNQMDLYIHQGNCVSECPSGLTPNETSGECMPCPGGDTCIKNCQNDDPREPITIFNLADADRFRGCQILNGTVIITLRNQISEIDLEHNFANITEIYGHLKIFRSPYLSSLKFLRNLRKIHGVPLESNRYALIIYDNRNLTKLWEAGDLEFEHGGMYVHRNNKMCNRHLRQFRNQVLHDKDMDSIQTSDREVLCEPAKLMLHVDVLSHRAIKLTWRKLQTSEQIEIIYRHIPHGRTLEEHSELDSNVCNRINWQRLLMFRSELQDNGTHYNYTIDDLEQYTKYACLVKTFGSNDKNDARSELLQVTTKMDMPTAPAIVIANKTDSSLTLRLEPQNRTFEVVNYYVVEVYELLDDSALLDTRNYCNQPVKPYYDDSAEDHISGSLNEDYDNCCARMKEEMEDRRFMAQMRAEYTCSLDHTKNCVFHDTQLAGYKPMQRPRVELNETTYTVQHLERFRLYVLQVYACNEVGCGSFSMHSTRTNYSMDGDKLVDLRACRVPRAGSTEYRVSFHEPQHPNGLVISYHIHFRLHLPASKSYQSHVHCVSRLEHAQANYQYITHLNTSFTEVAVRVNSLAGDEIVQVNVSDCTGPPATKLAGVGGVGIIGASSHGLNVFLVCFLLGAGGTMVWICYKRRYWRHLPELRRYLPLHRSWRALVPHVDIATSASTEDRQILVDEFETVRFHNSADEDDRYLE